MFHEYIERVNDVEDETPEPTAEDTPFLPMPLTILALLVVALRRQHQ